MVAWEGVAIGRRPPLVVLVVCVDRALLKLVVEKEEEGRRPRGGGGRPAIRGLLVLFGGGSKTGRGEEDRGWPGEVSFGRGKGQGV